MSLESEYCALQRDLSAHSSFLGLFVLFNLLSLFEALSLCSSLWMPWVFPFHIRFRTGCAVSMLWEEKKNASTSSSSNALILSSALLIHAQTYLHTNCCKYLHIFGTLSFRMESIVWYTLIPSKQTKKKRTCNKYEHERGKKIHTEQPKVDIFLRWTNEQRIKCVCRFRYSHIEIPGFSKQKLP